MEGELQDERRRAGFGGGHGIQGDLMGTAFILHASFSSIANLPVHLWSNKPHIIFQSFSRTQTKTGVLHPNLSRLLCLSLSLCIYSAFSKCSHIKGSCLRSRRRGWAAGITRTYTEKLLCAGHNLWLLVTYGLRCCSTVLLLQVRRALMCRTGLVLALRLLYIVSE